MKRPLEFALTYAHGLLAASSIGIISFYYAQISAEYELGSIAGNVIISMFSLCGAVGGLIAGWYLARTHLRHALCGGSALLAASSLGAIVPLGGPLAGPGFFMLRIVASFAFIIIVTVVPIAFARHADRRRVIGLALWGAYLPLGIALGNCAGALALRLWHASWQSTLAGHGVVTALATAALWRVDERAADRDGAPGIASPPTPRGDDLGSIRERLHRLGGAGLAYAAGFGAFTTVFLITAGVLPRTLIEVGGLAPSDAGVTASLVLALGGLGSLAVLYLLPRVRSARLLFGIGFAGSALSSFGLYMMARSPRAVACFAVAIIVISSLIPATAFAHLPAVVEHAEDVGALNGLLTQLGCIGSLIGPPLIGWWIGRFSYASGWIPFAIICATGFLLFATSLHGLAARPSHTRPST
jgi:predicted MFS family arabinose efflux permease